MSENLKQHCLKQHRSFSLTCERSLKVKSPGLVYRDSGSSCLSLPPFWHRVRPSVISTEAAKGPYFRHLERSKGRSTGTVWSPPSSAPFRKTPRKFYISHLFKFIGPHWQSLDTWSAVSLRNPGNAIFYLGIFPV